MIIEPCLHRERRSYVRRHARHQQCLSMYGARGRGAHPVMSLCVVIMVLCRNGRCDSVAFDSAQWFDAKTQETGNCSL
ncbi:hypothetical protein AUEXF2481DRAFT_418028 [Aureobasidium subglaciale EXF-2481]|uniref:Uncharacterized protein n=1 Tax=Aureobasidium subglaciale (strain EXF-2481) TaxID=1043005 RepID=A0A074YF98_AURSE|nr:uncharacterized protein AUEXF2481DRAFT_418028 [Aureobasidium subglaciale EXF-2481]KEQ92762.1 hypothetical protein AUEXF2481DRAFT_418028 [Aureobasidium subglaciale EXF-2481]